eukprot:CAMPEP_0184335228 /NCGR_PEP_ID=MMETSP1089-20130417/3828_1 /TAXON_ID=38269 ORGANISM="Gloeochaete wittrockiana, Strain SAG46.84" /NCGR_SAMPLE_ID=MMETSP1089 /ASSEMBLY_ACC=CAM_ASM_000445 /LENGTH=344 /DNA_ID=CAMNT_0026659785 /DNA_START=404 /DNA_END=1438 /DNA_ORIENTATION=-
MPFSKTTYQLLYRLLRNVPNLTSFHIETGIWELETQEEFLLTGILASHCPLLEELELEDGWAFFPEMSPDDTLRNGCPRLRRLQLSRLVPRHDFLNRLVHFLPNVVDLRLHEANLHIMSFPASPKLLSLSLESSTHLCDEHLFTMPVNLTHLDLQETAGASSFTAAHGLRSLAKRCPNLKSLYIGPFPKSADEAFVVSILLQIFTGLTELSIMGLQISNALFGQHQPNLETMSLTACEELCDEAVISLVRHNPQIKYLNLEFCEKLTDKAAVAVCTELSELRGINLDHTSITESSIVELEKLWHKRRKLCMVTVHGCSRLDVKCCTALDNLLRAGVSVSWGTLT